MDRQHNNDRLRDIVQQHRTASGAISTMSVAHMVTELTALMDECVEEALVEGFAQARQDS